MTSSSSAISTIFKGTGIILLGTALGRGLGLIGQVLIIRSLPPVEFGEISLAFTVASMVSTLFLFGLPEGVTRLIAADEEQASGYILGGLLISGIAGVMGAATLYLLRYEIASLMDEPALVGLLSVFSLYVVVRPFASSSIGALRGYQMYKPAILSQKILPKILLIVLFLGANTVGAEYWGAIVYWAVAPALIALFSTYYLVNKSSLKFTDITGVKNDSQELISFSWPLAFQTGFVLLMSNLDILLIGFLASSSDVGLYRSVQPLAVAALILLTAIVFVYLPIATRCYTENNLKTLDTVFTMSTKWIVHFSLPPLLLLLFFTEDIIGVLYGTSYTPASIALSILAVSVFLRIFVGPNGATIKAIGRTKVDLISSIFGVSVNAVLNVLLIPEYGITGAAIATTLGYVVFNGIELVVIHKDIGVHPFTREVIVPVVLTTAFIGILSYGPLTMAFGLLPLIMLGIGISLLHLCSIYFTGGFQEEDLLLIDAVEDEIGKSPVMNSVRSVIRSRLN